MNLARTAYKVRVETRTLVRLNLEGGAAWKPPIGESLAAMHELSVAQSIIELSESKARESGSRRIQKIKVRLGEFTTIAREALEFAFEAARAGTLAATAVLEIEIVKMAAQCASCGPVTQPAGGVCLICPQCGLPIKITAGSELEVEYVELE